MVVSINEELMNYLIIGLVGALVGALLPAEEGKFVLGFIPLRIFSAMFCAGLFCFLSFAGSGMNPDSY